MIFQRAKGFTLIEIIVVMAIISVLAAVAYPSYTENTRKGRRADARSVMLQAQQFIERSYTANLTGGYTAAVALLPTTLQSAPIDGATKYYTITVAATATTYTLTATPQTGAQYGDTCGTLTLTNAGVKGAAGSTSSTIVDKCWR